MSFIATVPESDATGEVAEIYARTVEATMGAALTLQSTYCSLAHAEKQLELGSPEAEIRSLCDRRPIASPSA